MKAEKAIKTSEKDKRDTILVASIAASWVLVSFLVLQYLNAFDMLIPLILCLATLGWLLNHKFTFDKKSRLEELISKDTG